jgi:hypothetical protein
MMRLQPRGRMLRIGGPISLGFRST